MSSSNSSLTTEIEAFVKKAAEANKVFMNEGAKLVQKVGTKNSGTPQIPTVQPDLLMDVFNSVVKLNIQHASNMIDLGMSFAKKMTGQEEDAIEPVDEQNTDDNSPQPAFELKAAIKAGETATVPFLLDNVKKETVVCQLVQSAFTHQTDSNIQPGFKAVFDPQSFPLEPAETKKVNILISTDVETVPGVYECHVQVLGFEPAFFSLYLTVN